MVEKETGISVQDHALIGFYILRPFPKDKHYPDLPEQTFTLTSCLATSFPDALAYNWKSDSNTPEARARLYQEYGFGLEKGKELDAELNELHTHGKIAFPSLFDSLETAWNLLNKYLGTTQGWHLIGFGLPRDLSQQPLDECEPEKSILRIALERNRPMQKCDQILGYDIMNIQNGDISCSFLCNHLQVEAKKRLGFSVNSFGLIPEKHQALKLAKMIVGEELGEPGPWFPFLVCDYTGKFS